MEIRYATPYVNSLAWVLNDPIRESVPVQNESGQPTNKIVINDPGITVEILPYLGNIPGQIKRYSFIEGADDGTSVNDVLTQAGVDVKAEWAAALDSMSNIFPILSDPQAGADAYGPPFYMRLDAWKAHLPWDDNKYIVATLGLYNNDTFDDVQAYVQLVFADGNTLRQREEQKAMLQDRIDRANNILSEPPTLEGWEDLPAEEQARLIEAANSDLPILTSELQRANAQLVAPLSDLLSKPEIQSSIFALLSGIFTVLKSTNSDYAQTDPASIMSKFVLPDVS